MIAVGWFVLIGTTASASSPNVGSVRPTGGQRGTEVEITLSGQRLGDAQQILWYQPGIETLSVEKVDDNNAKAKLRIGPEAKLGLYDFRLRTASGLSNLRTFSVGAMPEVSEQEPNSEFAAPQAIPMNVTVNGVAENEDVDFYVVEAKKGERITAEVEGIRLGITLFDPYVAILNADRFELDTSDDEALVRQDGVAQVIAPEDGKYVIQVRESSYQGNGACLYRLHVGNFPRPRAIVPAGGPLGGTVELKWIGDIAGDTTTTVALPAEPDPTFALFSSDEKGIAPHPMAFRLAPFGNVIEAEPNDGHDNATAFVPPMALNGVIEKDGDVDQFVFEAKKGQRYDIRVMARTLRSPLDSVIVVSKKGGGGIASNDDTQGPDSILRFDAPEDGTYVLSILDHLRKGSPLHFYRIEVKTDLPAARLSPLNENPQIGVVNVPVPRGNRVAMVLNARRSDYGGPLSFEVSGLPGGVAMQAPEMDASLGQMPVLFTATAEAPLDGTLASLKAKATDGKTELYSEFSHQVELVQGANQVPFWVRTLDTMAVSVAEEAPYSIEVVEPKVPLVRGGSMGLKVVAKRKEGFTAPIAVRLPWNPPGVGASGGISIAEGQTEAVIPMNAEGNAPLKTWNIVVNGYSNGPTGPLMVSSQLVPLTVAEKFMSFEYTPAAGEQGKETQLLVKMTKLSDFPGEATVKLIGLPHNASTEEKKVTKETTELVFPIKIGADTPVGKHANLFCQVVVTQEGEPILHNLGSGELRVDPPPPPKADAPPMPQAAAAPAPEAAPAKPLSRLEQLRKEQAEKAKQQSGGSEPPK